ncbi:MAG: hypothetical protein WD688_18415 [Candidatus Binatia bacterium]
MRKFDRAGVDLYLPDPEKKQFAVAIQCKGFETLNFGEPQLKLCGESIAKFMDSEFSCHEYLLIINRPYIDDMSLRKRLEAELAKLEHSGKAAIARLLDLQQFFNFFFNGLVEALIKHIDVRNREYLDQYETVMGSGVYIDHIPFRRVTAVTTKGEICSNPLNSIRQDIERKLRPHDEDPGRQLPKFWTIVVSEFGFGKTSLLLRLAREFKQIGLEALYIPIALIPPNGFDAETNFVRCLKQMIFEPDEEMDILRPNVWDVPLRHILQSKREFVLLLDGLDEHRYAYTHEGICQIVNGLRHLTRHVVISIRKEFWEERSGSIEFAIGGPGKNTQVVLLENWDDDTILSFLEARQRVTGSMALEKLRSIVSSGRYGEFYGDIPKRPLFLEMLCQDVLTGEIERRTVAELYEKYIIQKLERDIRSPFSTGKYPYHQLASNEIDLYDLHARLFLMLENIAAKTVVVDSAQVSTGQLLETFPEEWVKDAAKFVKLPAESVLPYLMGTVLVSAGRRNRQQTQLGIRFAHRSFQEYFIARNLSYTVNTTEILKKQLPSFKSTYSQGVMAFLESILNCPLSSSN